MANQPYVIGAAAQPAPKKKRNSNGKKKPARRSAGTTQVVVAQPEAPIKKKRRSSGKGKRQSGDLVTRSGAKRAGAGFVGALASQRLIAGKQVMGVPASIPAGLALHYYADNEMVRDGAIGMVVMGGVEWQLNAAITEGKLNEFLAPYIKGLAANGDANAKKNATAYAASLGITLDATSGTGCETTAADPLDDLQQRFAAGG